MHTGALTPPRIGWRTPETAQVTTPLKNCSGGIRQNPRVIWVAARPLKPKKVGQPQTISRANFFSRPTAVVTWSCRGWRIGALGALAEPAKAAQAGYECGTGSDIPPARAPTQLTRAKAMAQTVREKALIRQARENGRPSEDDVAQERLGWRGQKGRPRAAMMTEESKKETSPDLDPGHTS